MSESARRPTRQRRAVHDLLGQADGFVSAQELHQQLREAGQTVGLATVYRTLNAMADEGVIDVLRDQGGELRYRRCASELHHHHLVCRHCGKVVELIGRAVESWAAQAAANHGFVDVFHILEVFGTCPDCQPAH